MFVAKYLLILVCLLLSGKNYACDQPYDGYAHRNFIQATAKVFVGKVTKKKNITDSFGVPRKVIIEFLPIKVLKSSVSLNESFWYITEKSDYEFLLDDTYVVFATDKNELLFQNMCGSPGTYSLGEVTSEQLDKHIIRRRFWLAETSESRTELTWAKEYTKKKISSAKDKKELNYWKDKLKAIQQRLTKVF